MSLSFSVVLSGLLVHAGQSKLLGRHDQRGTMVYIKNSRRGVPYGGPQGKDLTQRKDQEVSSRALGLHAIAGMA